MAASFDSNVTGKTCYLLPGLALDSSIFANLNLNAMVRPMEWQSDY